MHLAPVSRRLAIPLSLGALAAPALMLSGCDNVADVTGPAPATPMILLNGQPFSPAQMKGKVTLVNFWATSCTTCVAEMPQMIDTYKKYSAQGFETVAVAMSYDPPAYVVNFTQTRALPFKVAIDNTGAVAKAWGDVKLTPTTYLLNKRAEIVKRYVGTPDFAALQTLIEKLLVETV